MEAFEQRHEGGEGVDHTSAQGEGVLSGGQTAGAEALGPGRGQALG